MSEPHSKGFISGLAWTFIALGALGLVCSAPLAIFSWFFVDPAAYAAAIDEAIRTSPVPVPPGVRWSLHHVREILVTGAVLSLFTLVAAVGLLRRREWARVTFIVLMWVGAVAHLFWAVAPFVAGDLARPSMALALVSAVFALAFGVLYGWVAIVLKRRVL